MKTVTTFVFEVFYADGGSKIVRVNDTSRTSAWNFVHDTYYTHGSECVGFTMLDVEA